MQQQKNLHSVTYKAMVFWTHAEFIYIFKMERRSQWLSVKYGRSHWLWENKINESKEDGDIVLTNCWLIWFMLQCMQPFLLIDESYCFACYVIVYITENWNNGCIYSWNDASNVMYMDLKLKVIMDDLKSRISSGIEQFHHQLARRSSELFKVDEVWRRGIKWSSYYMIPVVVSDIFSQ